MKAKNVVLCVVDQHTLPANNGVVQLFNVPHPKRFSPSPYMSLEAPDIERSQIDVGSSVTITTQEESAPRSEQDMAIGVEGSDSSKVVSDQEMMESFSPRNKDSLTVRRFCSYEARTPDQNVWVYMRWTLCRDFDILKFWGPHLNFGYHVSQGLG